MLCRKAFVLILQSGSKLLAHHQFCPSISSKSPKIRFSLIVAPMMPPKSHSMSKRSSKRHASLLTRKNLAETPKRPAKRAKNDKFVNPDSVTPIPSPSPPPADDHAPDDVLDVSQKEFTIARCCMLGSTPIMEDTDFVKLGEFSYRGFETTSIRKLDKAVAQAAKTGFEWDSGLATISA